MNRFARARRTGLFAVALAAIGAPLEGQQNDEPILDQLRATFAQEGLRIETLLQAVLDPGIDDATALQKNLLAHS